MADADPHVRAVKALLDAGVAGTAVDVHEGRSPNNAAVPYVVLYPDAGVASEDDLTFASDLVAFTFQITAVGGSSRQALGAADTARAAVLDVTPTVAGRACWPIRQGPAQPVRQDVDDPDLFVAIALYSFQSIPS